MSRPTLRGLWRRIARPDVPRGAGGPARPVPVTDSEVSVLTAAEYPETPPGATGSDEVRQQVDALGAGTDAATAAALDEVLLARERRWLAVLDTERAAHQSWVDGIVADGLSRRLRLDAELAEADAELARLDDIVALASARLRSPRPAEPRRRRR